MTDPSVQVFRDYRAQDFRVIDGDTFECTVDHGWSVFTRQAIRVRGVNTPERGQPGYSEAVEFTTLWLLTASTPDGWICLTPKKLITEGFTRTFTRYVADVIGFVDGRSLARDLIAAGLGVYAKGQDPS